jgi:hypothetical protein
LRLPRDRRHVLHDLPSIGLVLALLILMLLFRV